MAKIIKEISLETSKPNLIQAIVAKQNDCNSRFLRVSIFNQGTQIPILPTSSVTINAERNDGETKSFLGEVSDGNTAIVPLHSWMLEREGLVNCDVSIIDAESSKLTTTSFSVMVEKAACPSEDISTDPQYDVLADLIEEVNGTKPYYANALKGTASGNPVTITDASPLPHEMAVCVSVAGETVTKSGKNLFDPSVLETAGLVKTADGYYSGKGYLLSDAYHWRDGKIGSMYNGFLPNTQYAFRMKGRNLNQGTSTNGSVGFYFRYDDGTNSPSPVQYLYGNTDDPNLDMTIAFVSDPNKNVVGLHCSTSYNFDILVKEFQLEYGGVNTDFEEHKTPETYTDEDEDGMIHGFFAEGETIVLVGENDFTITVEYNRDINKAFAALSAAILNS